MGENDKQALLIAEYEQVNENFRILADIRFKLLALIPTLGGVASYVLAKIVTSEKVGNPEYAVVLLISLLGFVATLGILFYDQRNTELYNALIGRAADLEGMMHLTAKGQFSQRPYRSRHLLEFFSMGHDTGLAMIYGPVLGAWLFPIVYIAHVFFRHWVLDRGDPLWMALGVSVIAAAGFTRELIRLDESLPGQTSKIEGELSDFDLNKNEVTICYNSRNVDRKFKGELSRSFEQRDKLLEFSKKTEGRHLSITYFVNQQKVRDIWRKPRKIITKFEPLTADQVGQQGGQAHPDQSVEKNPNG
jgi:hypothetical protein